jgi:hypothetical protein
MAKLRPPIHTEAQTPDEAPGVSFGALRAALIGLILVITVIVLLYLFFTRSTVSPTSPPKKLGAAVYTKRFAYNKVVMLAS